MPKSDEAFRNAIKKGKHRTFNKLTLLCSQVSGYKIGQFRMLPAKEGLEKAKQWLKEAKQKQETAIDDSAYWGHFEDEVIAKVLIALFSAELRGVTDFPDIPAHVEFMSDLANLQNWAKKVEQLK